MAELEDDPLVILFGCLFPLLAVVGAISIIAWILFFIIKILF